MQVMRKERNLIRRQATQLEFKKIIIIMKTQKGEKKKTKMQRANKRRTIKLKCPVQLGSSAP